jgi:hypothetical protein
MLRTIARSFILIFCLCVASGVVAAQVSERKFEVGAVFTSITLDNFKARTSFGTATGDSTVRGLGGRLAYNFTDNVAVDAEGTFFPEAHFGNEEFGQKTQGFIGVKAGVHNKWAGVFAKARPGVMSFGEFSSRGSCTRIPLGSSCTVSHEKDFALDLGGVVEFYPAERVIIRADVGDTIIRFPERNLGLFSNPSFIPAETKHNFQVSIGVGWRF